MSSPQNPLNFFRTYSYHHILVACDGTRTAEELTRESEITQFDHERASKRFCPQSNNSGKYVVLINGMSDVQFTIKSAKWSSVLIPTDGAPGEGNTHFRTMAVDGEIEIEEPGGINFMNLLNEVTKMLKTDANGVTFVLKTVFVGHRDDGTTEFITNIRPLMFIMYDITAEFDITGARYMIAFVGVTNGAAKLPHVSAVADNFSFPVHPKASLKSTMDDLAAYLNSYYKKQKENLAKEATCANVEFNFDNEFFDVEYKIELHQDYWNFTAGTDELTQKLNAGNADAIIKKGTSISVEGVIDAIMMSSQDVLNEGKKENDKQYMHKITSSIETGPNLYIVTYHVQRYEAVVTPVEKFLTFEPPEGQGITFDYIFSGKNVDIKEFDMKMNMGMAFFQTLAATPSLASNSNNLLAHYNPQKKVSGVGNKEASGDQANQSPFMCDVDDSPRKKPFFLGMSLKDSSVRNRRLPGPASSYTALMMRHAAFENVEARVVIHGNPQLLEETTQVPSDLHPKGNGTKTDPQVIEVPDDTRGELRNLWPAVHELPGYVKINTFMPNSFSADKSQDDLYGNDFAQPFWYTGWWYVLSINNVFNDGEFTQELEMYTLPTDASQGKIGKSEEDCNTGSASSEGGTDTQTAETEEPDFVQTRRGRRPNPNKRVNKETVGNNNRRVSSASRRRRQRRRGNN